MGIFEEETWDSTPEVNLLEDGLFGTVRHKMRKKRKGVKMAGETEKKQKTEIAKADTEVTTPKKKQRGKRGIKKSKKKKEEENGATSDIDKTLQESNSHKKKLKMKKLKAVLKENAARGIFPKSGKAKNLLRNKYKYITADSKTVLKKKPKMKGLNTAKATDIAGEWVPLKNMEQGNKKLKATGTSGNVIKNPNLNQPKKKLKKKKGIHAEKKTKEEIEVKEPQDGKLQKEKLTLRKDKTQVVQKPKIMKLKRKKNEVKQQGDFSVAVDVKEPKEKEEKKANENVSNMACTSVSKKSKKLKTMADLSGGLFTQITTQQKKNNKKIMKCPTTEESASSVPETPMEPAKKRKINKLPVATRESINVENSESAENTAPTKKTKKNKNKNATTPTSPTMSTHESAEESTISPSKVPFNIDRLKHALENKPGFTKERSVKMDEVVSQTMKGKPAEPLTLRERMQAQLSGARFRYINEKLYTCTGAEAQQLMRKDPEAFKVYHEGFESQVAKWPRNPVTSVIRFIKARPKAVVADLGCGDAKLAQNVKNKVHSFDLVAVNEHVTTCDIAQVPLASESVDVAVFCLALMGTNLVDFICEANRILKQEGTLIVAEVVSRFEKVGSFIRKMSKLGFDLTKKDDSNKMFIWFEFTKTTDAPPLERRPLLELMPCSYKKR